MKILATYGVAFSALAYCDANGRPVTTLPPAELASHVFEATADGCLLHTIDGFARALVPPEGIADYARCWPACEPVARELIAADHVTPGPTTSETKVNDDARLAQAIARLDLDAQ